MNWLPFLTPRPLPPADNRFVPAEFEAPTPRRVSALPRAVPALRHEPLVAAAGPSCVLVSNDASLAGQCAMIALGAAVRISQCHSPDQLPTGFSGPVLWGADMLGLATTSEHACDVVVGNESDTERLWQAASSIPTAHVAVLPAAGAWLGEYLGLWGMRAGHGHTLELTSFAGGLGASTLAALIAHAGTLSDLRSVLIDLDPHSSGLWPLLSAHPPTGIGWEELTGSGGALAAHQLADTLPRLYGTAVLTWTQDPGGQRVEEQLAARLLAAARQGFDLLVLDTGRNPHPARASLRNFVDQSISLTDARLPTAQGQYIICRPTTHQVEAAARGSFAYSERIRKAATHGELLDALKSRKLRQQLADLRLLPEPPTTSYGGAAA